MSNPAWGAKHNCLNCDKLFYDMQKVPATCPTCHSEVKDLPAATRSNLLGSELSSSNDNKIEIAKVSEISADPLDVDLDFDDDLGFDADEFFDEDIEELIDVPENPYQDRI